MYFALFHFDYFILMHMSMYIIYKFFWNYSVAQFSVFKKGILFVLTIVFHNILKKLKPISSVLSVIWRMRL